MQFSQPVPNRAAGPRLVLAALAALLLLGVAAVRVPPARANVAWCWNDPVLVVNGRAVQLKLGVPLSEAATVTDATLVVTVPAGVPATLAAANAAAFITRLRLDVVLATDPSLAYNGTGPVPVRVEATINAPTSTKTGLAASHRGTVERGKTEATGGRPMRLAFAVP